MFPHGVTIISFPAGSFVCDCDPTVAATSQSADRRSSLRSRARAQLAAAAHWLLRMRRDYCTQQVRARHTPATHGVAETVARACVRAAYPRPSNSCIRPRYFQSTARILTTT